MPNLLRMLMDPLTDFPTRAAKSVGNMIDPAQGNAQGDRGLIKPFVAGALEGAGDLASQSTSPASILMTLAGANPAIQRALRMAKLKRSVGASDEAIRGLAGENAAWTPKGGTAGLHDARIAEREAGIYTVPDSPRAQELERVRKLIEDEYLMQNYGSLQR